MIKKKKQTIARALQAGDVVRLKHGGPWMTIGSIPTPTTAKVLWFSEAQLHTAELPINALEAD